MSATSLNRALARSAAETGQSAVHAAVTISGRLPVLAAGMLTPTAAGNAAWAEAYAEKVEAVWQGAFAASAAWGAALVHASIVPLTPLGFMQEWVRISDLAAGPARRKVRANAARYAPARRRRG